MRGIAFLLAGIGVMGWGVASKEKRVNKRKRGGVKIWVWGLKFSP